MKKVLAVIIAVTVIISCSILVGCKNDHIIDEGPPYYFDDQEFNTKYTAEEHEQRIFDTFNNLPDTTCYEVKVVYSLKEEHRFFIVHYKELSEIKNITEDVYNEMYSAGFIYNDNYFFMSRGLGGKKEILFKEYKDKKIYYFDVNQYAYENEEGKKIYIEADDPFSDERFKKKYLGGQSEVKKKYYKKIPAGVMWFNMRRIDDKKRATREETGFA